LGLYLRTVSLATLASSSSPPGALVWLILQAIHSIYCLAAPGSICGRLRVSVRRRRSTPLAH
jgi:hypothetical protein